MSLKEVKKNMVFYLKDDLRIFVGYFMFTIKRFFSIPKREISRLFIKDKGDIEYRNKVKGKKEIIKDVLGKKMVLPTEDKGLSRDLMIHGIREPHCVDIMKKILKKGMHVVEVGANIGYFVLQEHIILGNTGKIYAIEPNPLSVKYLKKNVKINSMKNVKLLNMGVSDKNGEMTFLMSKKWNLSRFQNDKKTTTSDVLKEIPVKIKTLDSLFANKKVNFIRTDIEGYEYQMIKGAQKVLSNNKNLIIFLEFHPYMMKKKQRKEMAIILKRSGFKIKTVFLQDPDNCRYVKRFTFKDMAGKPYFFPLHLVLEKKS